MPEWTADAATVLAALGGVLATLMGARFAWLRWALARAFVAALVAHAKRTPDTRDDAFAVTLQREIEARRPKT